MKTISKRDAQKEAKRIAAVILSSHPIGELLDEEGYSEEDKRRIDNEYYALIAKLGEGK